MLTEEDASGRGSPQLSDPCVPGVTIRIDDGAGR